MGTSWMFLYEAYSSIGVSLSSLAYYCGPVIVMAVTPLIFKEKLSKIKVFGFIIVLLGMLFVNEKWRYFFWLILWHNVSFYVCFYGYF